MHITEPRPTEQAYAELQLAYDHFNRELWNGSLPHCLITLQRRGHSTYGYFAPSRFANAGGAIVDEIALNPAHFKHQPPIEVLSTLAHEMAHLWQRHFGRHQSRGGYHNKEWAYEMIRIGLMPSDTGTKGGKLVGQRVSHYIVAGGLFETSAYRLLQSTTVISWFDNFAQPLPPPAAALLGAAPSRSGKRTKFRCRDCFAQAWGRDSLNLICGTCDRQMLPEDWRDTNAMTVRKDDVHV